MNIGDINLTDAV